MYTQKHSTVQVAWAKLWVLLAFVLVSCKPTVPSDYIQPGEMEDLLYDYHVAMSMAAVKNANPTEQEAYKLAVFERYGMDETKFESSLKYYMRHTERLKKIYENIDERLKKEAQAQGISASDFSQYGDASLKGDTANVWNRAKAMILMPQPPYNYHYFEVKTDTAFHKGDLLTLEFDPLFIVQDGNVRKRQYCNRNSTLLQRRTRGCAYPGRRACGHKAGAWLLLYAATARAFNHFPTLGNYQYQADTHARAEANACSSCRFNQ